MSAIHEPLKQLRQRTQAELLNDILPFWAKNAFDEKGWMTGVLAHDLRRFDDVQRHVVLCSRILWTFSWWSTTTNWICRYGILFPPST